MVKEKRWMIAIKNKDCIVLHLNENKLKQYSKMKRVSKWVIKEILK
jgi:hypothetical protein